MHDWLYLIIDNSDQYDDILTHSVGFNGKLGESMPHKYWQTLNIVHKNIKYTKIIKFMIQFCVLFVYCVMLYIIYLNKTT